MKHSNDLRGKNYSKRVSPQITWQFHEDLGQWGRQYRKYMKESGGSCWYGLSGNRRDPGKKWKWKLWLGLQEWMEYTQQLTLKSCYKIKLCKSVNSFPGPNLFIFDEIQHYDTTTILLPRTSIWEVMRNVYIRYAVSDRHFLGVIWSSSLAFG